MLGTLNGALEVRRVSLPPEAIYAEARGIHEIREKLPVLTEIQIRYVLRIPPGTREVVDRALSRHQERCPTAATLKGAVEIRWEAEIQEAAQ